MALATLSASKALPKRDSGLVTFVILSEGEDVTTRIAVMAISIQQAVNKIGFAILQIRDGDIPRQSMPVSDADWFIPGKKIEIQVGYHSQETTLFEGIVVRHEVRVLKNKFTSLIVEIREKAYRMTRTRKSNYFPNIKDSDLFAQIAEEYDIPLDIEPTRKEHPVIVQHYCTDWDFIVSRADQQGYLTVTKNGRIIIKKPSLENAEITKLDYASEQIIEFEAEIDARNSVPGIESMLWVPAEQTLQQVLSQNPENIAHPGDISNDDLASVLHDENLMQWYVPDLDSGTVQDLIDALWLRNQLATVRGRVCIRGYEGINLMDWIAFDGFGDRFNGEAFVSAVRHEVVNGGWLTHLEFGLDPETFGQKNANISAPAGAGLGAIAHGLHIGIVTKLEDGGPDGQRIRVRIPYIQSDGEGVWARWSTGFAGKKDDKSYGMVFRPELNDEVVVGFMDNDPNYPILLGALFSQNRPAPVAPEDLNHEKGLYFREGMSLVFNETEKSITISTKEGNQIVLSDTGQGIYMESQHGSKIQLDSNGISIDAGGKPVTINGTQINIG